MSEGTVTFQGGLEPHTIATQIVAMWDQWDMGKQKAKERWKEVQEYLHATSTKETGNSANPWSHTTHVPKLTQIADNLGANYASALFGAREFFTFEAGSTKEAELTKRQTIISYLTTKHASNGLLELHSKLLQDWVEYGNCFSQYEYIVETMIEPGTGQTIVVYQGPRGRRISPYDIVFDYTRPTFAEAGKIVRTLRTRASLIADAEQERTEYPYEAGEIQRLKLMSQVAGALSRDEINKNIQARFDGFADTASYFQSGMVEVLEFYGDIFDPNTGEAHCRKLYTVADQRFLIRHADLKDLKNIGQIVKSGWRDRGDNLWSMGPLDNLVGMQYQINHLENARADAFDQMLSPDRVHVGQVHVDTLPNGVRNYYIDDGEGSVTNLAPDTTVLNADLKIEQIEARMEAYAGAPREAMGIRSPGEKTAFEVQELRNAAGRLFQHKIEKYEREQVEPGLNAELEIGARNLSTVDDVRVFDDQAQIVTWQEINKDDLLVKGKLRARGSSHYAKRAQLVQELREFNDVLQKDPNMSVHFPALARAKAWEDALGLTAINPLFAPFGQVAEDLQKQKMLTAAQQLADENAAAAATPATPPEAMQ
ncbi:MAG: hypothetical protein M0P95_17755 [Sulfuritalea sp.]|jgi:hypothetical protein|nr:hypothetical protein [Sulfuritalea sp.]